jgi:hypothetical protein
MLAKEAEAKCKQAGYSGGTLDRALMRVGVVKEKLGFVVGEGAWTWKLPAKSTTEAA